MYKCCLLWRVLDIDVAHRVRGRGVSWGPFRPSLGFPAMFISYWDVLQTANFSNINSELHFQLIFPQRSSTPKHIKRQRFMNETPKPDSPVDQYKAWHTNCRSTACFLARCLSCVTHAGCARLPLEHQSWIFKSLVFSPPQNHETSELKMGPRHTIAHHPQTAPPPAEIL